MADGTPFDETRTYRVAVNSYRAAGGGGLLTKGAGIDKAQLESRITWRGRLHLARLHNKVRAQAFAHHS